MKLSRISALFEQALISGSNFLILIFAARILEPSQWGTFSFALACVLMIQGLQRAAVILPMVNQCATPAGLQANLSSWNRMQWIATALSVGTLLVAALPIYPSTHQWIAHSAGVAALITAPVYFYEFNRRVLILKGLQHKLIRVAVGYACVLLVGATALHLLAADSLKAIVIIYLSGQLAGALGTAILLGRPDLKMTWTTEQIAEQMLFARWAFLSSIAFSGYNFAIQAILAALSGPAAVGLFNAARNFVQPINTLIQAMDSVDKPRASKQFANAGLAGLRSAIFGSLRWLLLIGGPFCVLVALFGEDLLVLVYGARYQGQGHLMQAWAVAACTMLLAHPIETGLLVKRVPKLLFLSRLFAALAALVLGLLLIPSAGAIGAVVSLAIGWALAAVIGFGMLRK